MFKNRNKIKKQLEKSFGKIKDEYFRLNLIRTYFDSQNDSPSKHKVEDNTISDLDFDELFMFLDRTTSKVGQQFLYNKLLSIELEGSSFDNSEQLIDLFSKNDNFRTETQLQLKKLQHENVYLIHSLIHNEFLKPPKWFFVVPLLSFASLLSAVLTFYSSNMLLIFIALIIVNFTIHYWNKRNLNVYVNSIPQLLRLISVADQLNKKQDLRTINPNLGRSIKNLEKIKKGLFFIRLESGLQDEISGLIWGVFELFKMAFLLEPLFLFQTLKKLELLKNETASLFEFVGEIDSLISIASLRKGLETWCSPQINPNLKSLSLHKSYHPLIPNCIENDIELNQKSILLTGSNMSGKTSFIRSVAINTLCGLTINTCFASKAIFHRMKIYSAIRISDDLLNDRSYYLQEVLTVNKMLKASQNSIPCMFLLDEIFKGTNTIERIAAGKAVLSYLNRGNNLVFVSTHDIELADLLQEEFDLYHFSEQVDNRNIEFDFKLKNGKLKNRNAIRILEVNGYPDSVIQEANELTKIINTLPNSN